MLKACYGFQFVRNGCDHSKFGIQQKSEFFVHQILRINMGLDFFKRPTKVCVKTPSRRRYKKEEIIVVVT